MSAPRWISLGGSWLGSARSWLGIARSWLGIVAAAVAVVCAVWLASEYAHARYVTPIEKARVDALRLRAKTDAEVQKILKPEWDRQHEELVRRRAVYRWSGLTLLISIGVFFVWIRWLRPADDQWGRVPPRLVHVLARPRDHPRLASPPPRTAAGASAGASGASVGAPGASAGAAAGTSAGASARASAGASAGAAAGRSAGALAGATTGALAGALAGATAGTSAGATGAAAAPFVLPVRTREAAAPLDLADIDAMLRTTGTRRDSILPVLQAIQARYRYLPEAALRRICATSEMSPSQMAGVASFYGQFRLTPTGEHVIRVCEGTACHVSGAVDVRTELRRCLGMTDGADTDPTGTFTIERVACIGSCSLAPVITIDDQIYGHLTALSVAGVLGQFVEHDRLARTNGNGSRRKAGPGLVLPTARGAAPPIEIRIGVGTCGRASGADAIHAALQDTVAAFGGGATIKAVGCAGLCHHEPLVEVVADGRSDFYGNVGPDDVRKLVRRHVRPRGLLRTVREEAHDIRARFVDDRSWVPIAARAVDPAPYLSKQVRVVLENCGEVDPLSLEEYRRRDGMKALETCLTALTPDEVIARVRTSGLRGRGGAGFPTAIKWDLTRRAAGDHKYVICNGDEGDPGAFMDRAVLESDPFRVIEGLTIAAYAVGASEGIVYVRSEYPIAVRHTRAAIAAAEAAGLLGANILGSSFSFALQVREGAGAFVCGEETALIQSIEGERGMPRLRPPYPAESGLRGEPTLINNVETLACLPWIFRRGPEAFAAMGTASSKGTKVFSLTGKVKRSGLIEVPMGITIREIVEDIGGGMKDGRRFKAVLAGGPSGGCIPESLADTPIDFEALASTGAIMGSGGLVVLDDRDCAVDLARYFLHFTQSESCGKCTYCRVGTKRMLEILERICDGRGMEGDLAVLDELSQRVRTGSLCGLGQTAPNPVLTTMRYFRDEYEAHIRERRCPAASCKALIHFRVLENCTGCTLCAQACPAGAIDVRPYVRHEVADDLCTRCGMCVTACPENAIEVA